MELVCTGGELAMTDVKCPHCGAFERIRAGVNTGFICGTASIDGRTLRSIDCCIFELNNLKAKVAAQQELLDDIRNNLYVQTFDTCPPGYAGIINEGMLRRLGVKLSDA